MWDGQGRPHFSKDLREARQGAMGPPWLASESDTCQDSKKASVAGGRPKDTRTEKEWGTQCGGPWRPL